jgi:hypothetical protein
MPEFSSVLLYIDPGIGFLTLQILAGSMLGIAFYYRQKTSQILKNVRLMFRRKDGEEPESLDR